MKIIRVGIFRNVAMIGYAELLLLLAVSPIIGFPYQSGWPQPIEEGVYFSSPCLADVDLDDTLEIAIASNTRWVYLFDHRGALLPGWPRSTATNPNSASETSSPAVGDIDFDGEMEIVFASDIGQLFAWEIDGGDVTGFPVVLGDRVIRASVTLEDITNDDSLEICIGTGFAQYLFFVYRHNGLLHFQKNVEFRIHSTAAVADVDKDGALEIIHGVDREVQFGVYGWQHDGSPVPGWPVETGHHVDGSPAVADVDGDSTYEIFVGSIDNQIYGWDFTGNNLPSWPNGVGSGVYQGVVSSPAIGDIDGNGILDIVVGRGIIQSTNGAIFAFSALGDTLPGFPVIIPTGSTTSSPVLADIDGDAEIEIIIGCQDGKLYAFNHDGSPVDSFPLDVCTSITSTPAVGDLDLDGDIEIVVGGKGVGTNDDSLYIWDLPTTFTASRIPWPMFHHDQRHTGRFPLDEGAAVSEKEQTSPIESLRIYPSISSGEIYFIPEAKGPLRVKVYNALGREVKNTLCFNDRCSLRGLKSGIYFIKCWFLDKRSSRTCKITVIDPENR
jgi:hypothetical protein